MQQSGAGSLPRLRPPAVKVEEQEQRGVQPRIVHGGELSGAATARRAEPAAPRGTEVPREKPRSAMKGITDYSAGEVEELLQELGESGDMEVG